MHWFNNVRRKLLGLLGLSLALSFALAATTISVFVNDFHREATRERFKEAVISLRQEMLARRSALELDAETIATDADVVTSLNMLSQYDDTTLGKQHIFDDERRKLVGQLRRLSSAKSDTHIALLDGQARLISLLSISPEAVTEAYAEFGEGQPRLLARRLQQGGDWSPADPPAALRVLLAQAGKTASTSWHRNGQALLLLVSVPVSKNAGQAAPQQIGSVVLIHEFSHAFIEETARHAGVGFTIQVDPQKLPDAIARDVAAPPLWTETQSAASGWHQTTRYFYEVRSIALADGSQAYPLFSVDTDLLRSQVQRALGLIFAALLVSTILVLLLGQALALRWISRPAQQLVASIAAIKRGEYESMRHRDDAVDDFGLVSRALVEMADTVRQREREIINSRDALAQSESRLAQIMAVTGEGIWDWDLQSDTVKHNERWHAMLGGADKAQQHPRALFVDRLHEEDRGAVMQRIQGCLAGLAPYRSEHRMRRNDGELIWVEDRGDVVERDAAGRPTRMLGSMADISARMQAREALLESERQLRQLNESLEARVLLRTAEVQQQNRRNELILGAAIDGFFITDTDGRLRDTNPAFCQLLGYTRSELLRLSIPDIEGSESPQAVAAHVEKVRRLGYDRFDTLHRRKDGALVDVEISVNLVELAGEPLLFAFVRDISPRKAAEAELRRARDEADQANAAKSEFLSRMSHELRTPLNAILGFGQLLALEAQAPTQAGQVREILRAGQHLLVLINEVLDLARVESGQLAVSPEPVALKPLIEDCLTLVLPQARSRQVQLLDPIGVDRQTQVVADRTRLKQVLLNLLSNAIKYNRVGGTVCIRVGSMHDRTGAPRVSVSVVDSGSGLNAAQQARLFIPFERLDADASIEGTGIGLALSKRLVELMGGEIDVESAPGVGSRFRVALLPAQPGEFAPDDASEAPASALADAPAAPGAARFDVLCIEDNPANLRLIESILARRPQIRLLSAIAPGFGLELARTHRPALILLDINLPDMDGYALMQCLRESELTRDIPVVAISANAMPKDIERGRAAGFVDYLTKPIDLPQLLAAIDRRLNP